MEEQVFYENSDTSDIFN